MSSQRILTSSKISNQRFPKKLPFFVGVILLMIIIPVAYYLISPLFIVKEANEVSPLFAEEMEKMKDEVIVMDETMPSSPTIESMGQFVNQAHEVSGEAFVINTAASKILRFENFETLNGPDLHIYIAKDLRAETYIDLGKIKATKGNVNYEIPSGINLSEYKYILVWCEPFRVLFGYAELGKN